MKKRKYIDRSPLPIWVSDFLCGEENAFGAELQKRLEDARYWLGICIGVGDCKKLQKVNGKVWEHTKLQ